MNWTVLGPEVSTRGHQNRHDPPIKRSRVSRLRLTLRSVEKYAEQGAALVMAVAKLMGALGPDAVTARAAVQEASDSRPPGPSSNHPDNHPAPALPKILELGGEHARALGPTQRRPVDGTKGVHWQQGGQVPHARR